MNTEEELSDALRWQLRALRRDEPPQRDLWSGIAERLPAQQPARPSRRWLAPVAAAAGIVLAIGVVGVWHRAGVPMGVAADTLVQREADGMTRQYQAALQELAPAAAPEPLQPTLDELDREVVLIRDALTHDPDSRLLLERLRRTYAHRLALAQRLTQGMA